MRNQRRGGVRRRLTYANVMSTIAVGIALAGGTAVAANVLPPNSVTSKTVKNNSLTGLDLKNGSVRPVDLAGGVRGYWLRVTFGEKSVNVAPGASASVGSPCPNQAQVISGGAHFENATGTLSRSTRDAFEEAPPIEWTAAGTNHGTTPQKLTVETICAFIEPETDE
jgi:hypothetical protein